MIFTLLLLAISKVNLNTKHESACVWIAAPTIVDTWVDTTEVNLSVKSLIACNSEYVVSCAIESEILNPVLVFATYCKSIYYILNGRIVITLIL